MLSFEWRGWNELRVDLLAEDVPRLFAQDTVHWFRTHIYGQIYVYMISDTMHVPKDVCETATLSCKRDEHFGFQ